MKDHRSEGTLPARPQRSHQHLVRSAQHDEEPGHDHGVFLIVNVFIAYVLTLAFEGGEPKEYISVFRVVGTIGVMAHCFGSISNELWFHKPARAMAADFFDGVVYALLTAGLFGWLGANALGV